MRVEGGPILYLPFNWEILNKVFRNYPTNMQMISNTKGPEVCLVSSIRSPVGGKDNYRYPIIKE